MFQLPKWPPFQNCIIFCPTTSQFLAISYSQSITLGFFVTKINMICWDQSINCCQKFEWNFNIHFSIKGNWILSHHVTNKVILTGNTYSTQYLCIANRKFVFSIHGHSNGRIHSVVFIYCSMSGHKTLRCNWCDLRNWISSHHITTKVILTGNTYCS